MAAIPGAELQFDRYVAADPNNGVIAVLDYAGVVQNILTYNQATGDVNYFAPAGNGANTRAHRFNNGPLSAITPGIVHPWGGGAGASLGTNVTTLHLYGGTAARGGGVRVSTSNASQEGSFYVADGAVELGAMTNHPLSFRTNNVVRWQMAAAGHFIAGADNSYDLGAAGATRPRTLYLGTSLVIGAPGGGDKGAGTINVSVGIYLNNTAYTNPDYVLEAIFTGKIERHLDKPGARSFLHDFQQRGDRIMTIEEDRAFARDHLHLPGAHDVREGFARMDFALAQIEITRVYLWDHEDRIKKLERDSSS